MSASRLFLAFCVSLGLACESEPEKKADAPEKKADAPEKSADAPEKKRFDVSLDKSGALARSAAVLDLDEGVDTSDALHGLSHHA